MSGARASSAYTDVCEPCVIGVQDDKWREAVTTFLVLREGARVERAEVMAFLGHKLAAYSRPKHVDS